MAEPRKYTEAQKQSAKKWDAANLDRVSIAMPKGKKDEIKAHAESKGESVNAFINRAIDNQMERDNEIEATDRTAKDFGVTREQVLNAVEFGNVVDRLSAECGLSKWEVLEKIAKLKEEAGE